MEWAPFAGTLVQVGLLALALADRILSANRELLAQRAAIIQADKLSALGRMAGEIAHEISSPLAIIHGNSVLIRQQLEAQQTSPLDLAQLAETIESTAMRISRVVKGMRSLSRDSRRDPFQGTLAASILQDSLALCGERIRQSAARFAVAEIPEGLALRCRGSEISQVLVNLLNNAFDAVEGRKDRWVKIEMQCRGEWAEISVVDNGLGVPKAIRQKIHEPFFTTKEAGKGIGLGLSISRTIVDGHGGDLWLDEGAEFTRFVFTVPIAV